jgi:opacity protein-like surface antigen
MRTAHRWPWLLCLVLAPAVPLAAQAPGLRIGAGIGPLDFDGRARTVIIGARLEVSLSPNTFLDVGVAWFSRVPSNGPADTLGFLMPDVGLAFQLPLGRLRPYVGAGVGLVADLGGGGGAFSAVHVAAGVQLDLWGSWAARLDYRVRALASPHTDSREITVGLTTRLRLPWSKPD